MTSPIRISACLIVKNEAHNIPALLATLAPIDEVVIVDTGSTDETLDLLRSESDIVLGHFDWVNDFAAARNAALDLATGDWVLVIDADERITLPDTDRLKAHLAAIPLDLVNVRVTQASSADGVAASDLSFMGPRLFRREIGRYQGRVHEQIVSRETGQLLTGLESDPGLLEVVHFGATLAEIERKDSYGRNAELARLALEDDTDSTPPEKKHWDYARSLAAIPGRGDLADEHYALALAADKADPHGFRSMIVFEFADFLHIRGRDQEALDVLATLTGNSPERGTREARSLLILGRVRQAESVARVSLSATSLRGLEAKKERYQYAAAWTVVSARLLMGRDRSAVEFVLELPAAQREGVMNGVAGQLFLYAVRRGTPDRYLEPLARAAHRKPSEVINLLPKFHARVLLAELNRLDGNIHTYPDDRSDEIRARVGGGSDAALTGLAEKFADSDPGLAATVWSILADRRPGPPPVHIAVPMVQQMLLCGAVRAAAEMAADVVAAAPEGTVAEELDVLFPLSQMHKTVTAISHSTMTASTIDQ